MTDCTSHFIFSLADKYQISLDNTKPSEFLDENYYGFCQEYLELCKIRDINLKRHLTDNPNLFRTFLPWRPYIFDTVFQLQWYYDELVIYDPVYFEINNFKTGNIENDKSELRQLLSFLALLKDSINEGFLLFGSYDTFLTSNKKIADNKFENLLSVPELRYECDKLVQVYKMESEEGKEKSYFNIRANYRNKETFFTVVNDFEKIKTEEGYAVNFDLIGSEYIPVSVESAKREGFYDRAYDGFKNDYPFEIREVLNYIDIGSNMKTPVLFNRKLDELILSKLSQEDKIVKSRANDYYKLFLPFVNDIPANRLYEVRSKMPTAFLDFRGLMFEIIYDFEKSGVEPDILELKIQQKINPLLRKLEVEMKNSVTKAKIIGGGLPVVSGFGALGLWYFGIDISKYASLLLGGLNVAGLTSFTNYLTEQKAGKSNTVYYLWKVQQ